MGVQRKRRRREERLEEEEQERGREPEQEAVQEKERPPEREATAVDRVIDLQKTAGNRATTAALSRWGFATLPLAAAPHWPKEPQLIADGVVLPLESWSWGPEQRGGGTAGGVADPGGELVVTTKQGEHSAEWWQRTARGTPFKRVLLVQPGKDGKGVTVTLTDVVIVGSQFSNQMESWTLNFKQRELSQAPPQAQPRP